MPLQPFKAKQRAQAMAKKEAKVWNINHAHSDAGFKQASIDSLKHPEWHCLQSLHR